MSNQFKMLLSFHIHTFNTFLKPELNGEPIGLPEPSSQTGTTSRRPAKTGLTVSLPINKRTHISTAHIEQGYMARRA